MRWLDPDRKARNWLPQFLVHLQIWSGAYRAKPITPKHRLGVRVMGEQRLHSALAPVDILTRAEHQDVMDTSLEHALRTKYKGVENQRFPRTYGTGAVTLNLFDPNAP